VWGLPLISAAANATLRTLAAELGLTGEKFDVRDTTYIVLRTSCMRGGNPPPREECCFLRGGAAQGRGRLRRPYGSVVRSPAPSFQSQSPTFSKSATNAPLRIGSSEKGPAEGEGDLRRALLGAAVGDALSQAFAG
jgi:hypothetical protein